MGIWEEDNQQHFSIFSAQLRFLPRIPVLTFLDNEPIRLNKPLPPEIVFGLGVYYSNRNEIKKGRFRAVQLFHYKNILPKNLIFKMKKNLISSYNSLLASGLLFSGKGKNILAKDSRKLLFYLRICFRYQSPTGPAQLSRGVGVYITSCFVLGMFGSVIPRLCFAGS